MNIKRWVLDPKEVFTMGGGSYSKSHGHPSKTTRTPEVTLFHQPTGIKVMRTAPTGNYSREQAAKIREQLIAELFPELERLVAKHLHIPGR